MLIYINKKRIPNFKALNKAFNTAGEHAAG